MSFEPLDETSMIRAARKLAKRDRFLGSVLDELGPPPLWRRPANFATFVRIILEQQVSLASAKSTFNKLRAAAGSRVTAKRVNELGLDELRSLGFSRQKARYTMALSDDVIAKRFVVGTLRHLDDDQARSQITARLGLGDWSADVFLIMALMRPDLFPVGDLALIKGMTMLDGGQYDGPEKAVARAEGWRPYRSVATRMIWQLYLSRQGKMA